MDKLAVAAKIGDTEYTSYEKAWEYVQTNGGTIEVLSDWVLDSNLIVPKDKIITVNMYGHNIRRNFAPGQIKICTKVSIYQKR